MIIQIWILEIDISFINKEIVWLFAKRKLNIHFFQKYQFHLIILKQLWIWKTSFLMNTSTNISFKMWLRFFLSLKSCVTFWSQIHAIILRKRLLAFLGLWNYLFMSFHSHLFKNTFFFLFRSHPYLYSPNNVIHTSSTFTFSLPTKLSAPNYSFSNDLFSP